MLCWKGLGWAHSSTRRVQQRGFGWGWQKVWGLSAEKGANGWEGGSREEQGGSQQDCGYPALVLGTSWSISLRKTHSCAHQTGVNPTGSQVKAARGRVEPIWCSLSLLVQGLMVSPLGVGTPVTYLLADKEGTACTPHPGCAPLLFGPQRANKLGG